MVHRSEVESTVADCHRRPLVSGKWWAGYPTYAETLTLKVQISENSVGNGVGGSLTVLQLKTLIVGHGGSGAGSYLTNPAYPMPSHCTVIILFKSVPVHQLS